MRVLYKVLDHARDRDIDVVFGEWWLPESYRGPLGGVTGARWPVELIAPFLIHLRDERGYKQITHFNLMNEPSGQKQEDGSDLDYGTWRSAIINLNDAFRAAGLDGAVRIVGPDGPGDFNGWVGKVAGDAGLRGRLGAYEYHLYAHLGRDKWLPSLLEGELEAGELRVKRQIASDLDPGGEAKPFFMGEAAINDGNEKDNQVFRSDFAYGVWMADYAIQAMRAGLAGLIAWDMDDAMHTGGSYGPLGLKGWGFWNSLAGSPGYPEADFAIRPWFYAWSLLCRSFPRGCRTVEVSPTGDPAVRVAAAILPGGRGPSLAIVNEAEDARRVMIVVPKATAVESLRDYHYFDADRPADADGFPMSVCWRDTPARAEGIEVVMPSKGVVILTP